MLAINSAKGPHVDCDYFAAQICEAQGRVYIQPGIICQFGSRVPGQGVRREILAGS